MGDFLSVSQAYCWERGIGKMVHNVPFTFGDPTYLHTVYVAQIKELCLLGLVFLKATGCVLDLASDILEIAGNVFSDQSGCIA